MLKVAIWHWGGILAAEYATLKVGDRSIRGSFKTGRLEIVEALVDDFIGIDVLCNILPSLFMCNKLLRTC